VSICPVKYWSHNVPTAEQPVTAYLWCSSTPIPNSSGIKQVLGLAAWMMACEIASCLLVIMSQLITMLKLCFTQSPEMSSELGYSTAHLCCMACHIICEAIKRPTLFTNISASSICAPDLSAYHLLLRTCSANPLQQNSPGLPSGGAMLWQMHCQFAEMHCQLHCLHFRISKQNCVNNRTMLLPWSV